MRIYTKAGDLAFSTFTFPDGQPHFKLETYEIDFRSVTVETAIRNPNELFQTLLVSQVLRSSGYTEVNLDIRYLLGARMDRAIGSNEPFTLECVARLINGAGFSKVRILDVHSEVATRLIRNSSNVLPYSVVAQVLTTIGEAVVIVPDEGAKPRVQKLMEKHFDWRVGYGGKKRDMATGKLSGFFYGGPSTITNQACLIVDDICDGGGTFTGLAKVLREAGAKKVYLYVTHGIFSKGLPLEGIDKVFTTDSYFQWPKEPNSAIGTNLVVIPISMKEMK